MRMALVKITCLSFLFSPHLVSASTTLWLLNPLSVFRVNFVMADLHYLQLTAHTVDHLYCIISYLDSRHLPCQPQGTLVATLFSPSALIFCKAACWK